MDVKMNIHIIHHSLNKTLSVLIRVSHFINRFVYRFENNCFKKYITYNANLYTALYI
jgi:hypothetical protein